MNQLSPRHTYQLQCISVIFAALDRLDETDPSYKTWQQRLTETCDAFNKENAEATNA